MALLRVRVMSAVVVVFGAFCFRFIAGSGMPEPPLDGKVWP
jgi:hypothetical protein